MKFSEAHDILTNVEGCRRIFKYNFDLKNGEVVLSVLLTTAGCGGWNHNFYLDNNEVKRLDKECKYWFDLEDNELEEKLKELNIKLPDLPLPNPHFTIGYNDPCGDLMAYWKLDEVINKVSPSEVGCSHWFTADMDNFYEGPDKILTKEEEEFVKKILEEC